VLKSKDSQADIAAKEIKQTTSNGNHGTIILSLRIVCAIVRSLFLLDLTHADLRTARKALGNVASDAPELSLHFLFHESSLGAYVFKDYISYSDC
jgi:hypothetical protein